jgi:hypothetical protein
MAAAATATTQSNGDSHFSQGAAGFDAFLAEGDGVGAFLVFAGLVFIVFAKFVAKVRTFFFSSSFFGH